MDPDADPGGSKTYGSYGSATLLLAALVISCVPLEYYVGCFSRPVLWIRNDMFPVRSGSFNKVILLLDNLILLQDFLAFLELRSEFVQSSCYKDELVLFVKARI
jgi:hypothetical protein